MKVRWKKRCNGRREEQGGGESGESKVELSEKKRKCKKGDHKSEGMRWGMHLPITTIYK